VDSILREFDYDHSRSLDKGEFAAFINKRCTQLHTAFHELDVSRTGTLSASDLRHALQAAQVPHLSVDVDMLLKKLGADKTGAVTWEHFLEASFLLPAASTRELLCTQAGCIPFSNPPPGTTPLMIMTAGFINGGVSRTLTAPFDRLRAVLATGRETGVFSAAQNILKTQGVRGFWNSNLANVIQVCPENSIAFTLNTVLQERFCKDSHAPSIFEKFVFGSVAGATAMSAVYPMYVIQNRMAAATPGQYRGTMHCAQQVAAGGFGACYAGYTVSLIRVLPLKGIMLGGYSTLKDLVKDPDTGNISTAKSLGCSAVAGGFAHAFTYPLHLARTVLQQEVPPGGKRYAGFLDVLQHRVKTQGIRGCYAGLPIWLCNRIPAVAIEFAVNERALDAMRQMAALKQQWKSSRYSPGSFAFNKSRPSGLCVSL